MKWFRRIMTRRKPDGASNIGFLWVLFECRWFGVALVLRHRSDSRFDRPAECNRIKLVLEGEYCQHSEVSADEKVDKDAYVYLNAEGRWSNRLLQVGELAFERAGHRGGVELLDARTQGERMVDFAEWMALDDVVFDSERQVVWLMIAWGGVWTRS